MITVQPYIDLISTQHRAQPKFAAMMAIICQPFVDGTNSLLSMPTLFDIDSAAGVQLDVVGQWIGVSRNLTTPILTYFTWDAAGAGWDQGTWKQPSDPMSGLVVLNDDHFRALLKAKVLNNHWDGDIPDAYILMNSVFQNFGYTIGIKDNGDLTMELILIGAMVPDAVLWSLFTSGLLDIRPVGIQIIKRTYASNMALLDTSFVLDVSTLV